MASSVKLSNVSDAWGLQLEAWVALKRILCKDTSLFI